MEVYKTRSLGMLRAPAYPGISMPPWPDLSAATPANVTEWTGWLLKVTGIDEVADAIGAAAPGFAGLLGALCVAEGPEPREIRRAVLTMIRYLQRLKGRCTPTGLFAGVAPVRFAATASVCWGEDHHAVARPGAEWLAEVIRLLDGCPPVLARLPVVANTMLMVRGDRIIVPYQATSAGPAPGAADVSIRDSAPVRRALRAASAPVITGDLIAEVQAEFPQAGPAAVFTMVAELVRYGALITSLHAPGTAADALAHLTAELEAVGAGDASFPSAVISSLVKISDLLGRHNSASGDHARRIRRDAVAMMRSVAQTRQHPLAIDMRLDASLVLPDAVAREAERAALLLTRLAAHPAGTPAWRAYHQRFYERYGLGSLVPVLDMVSDSGIGWPDGYPGTPPAERARLSRRDELLLAMAQDAALDGRDEMLLDEADVASLETGPAPLRPPPHLELGVRIHAADTAAVERGAFTVHVVTVSRAAGVLTGRFLPVLDRAGSAALSAALASVPCNDQDTVAVQMSFPPLDPATAHVTRVPQVLAAVISLGEHRPPHGTVVTAADLAAGCDGRRMYLAVPRWGTRVEAMTLHALNLRKHTPPLARLLAELSGAQCAQVTAFDWGAAAKLPFLPRVRSGRAVLSPARWRLPATALPGRQASWPQWAGALNAWREQRRVPGLVHLVEGDQRLPLDLAEPAHCAVLRAHLASTAHASVTEAPADSDHGWSGGRPHEIIFPLTAIRPARWPLLPAPVPARLVRAGHGHLPATAGVLLASLYGDLQRQDDILARYLPDLLGGLGEQPRWWYIRYRDPGQHLRLRIILASPDAFGQAARTVSTWAARLCDQGLLREVRYPADYPETGRWGSGLAWTAAQQVFEADSAAVLTQLGLPGQPARQALAAAHAVAISAAFTGSLPAGMQWLLDHVPAAAPGRIPRPVLDQARHLADPAGDWAALRSEPGGDTISRGWADRDRALAEYRTHLDGPDTAGIRADDVLSSLLHVNFVRGYRIDFGEEAVCMYLARAAALSWIARAGGQR